MLVSALAGHAAFTLLATIAGVFSVLFALLSIPRGFRMLRRREDAAELPPISIIKPLRGHEKYLRENLASFCRQNYPCFQVILCIQSELDPAMPVVKEIQRAFPHIDLEVVVSTNRMGFNPKVNNMANGYPFAKYDLILMSDSDISAAPDLLRRMAAPFSSPRTGLVTAFYEATMSRGFWGHLEALSINSRFLPEALTAASYGMRFAMGAAMMVRRSAFDEIGGFQRMADHLADDWWLGQSLREAGWSIDIADATVETVPDITSAHEHFQHLVRWARTIRICNPWGYAGSLIQQGFALLFLKIIFFGLNAHSLALLLCVWGAKALATAAISSRLSGRQSFAALALIPVAELLAFGAWVAGCFSTRVLWRGQLYEVEARGRLVPRPTRERRPVPVAP